MNRTYILFLVFTIFAFTACTGTEEQLQQLVEDEVPMPMEETEPEIIESAPQPLTLPPSDLPVTSAVVSEILVVPPLVSNPPVEDPEIIDPPVEDPTEVYYPPGTVLITLSGGGEAVQEGVNFTVRVDIVGVPEDIGEIVEGGCTVFMHDNHGHNTYKYTQRDRILLTTVHDDLDDDNRTAKVQILNDTCDFPQLDAQEIRYEIDRNHGNDRVVVDITTAGPVNPPDDGVYTLTIDNLRVEGIRHYFDIVVDNPIPESTAVNFRHDWTIVYHDVPSSLEPDFGGFAGLYRYDGTNWRYGDGSVWTIWNTSFDEDNIYTWFWDMGWWPTDFDKTLTVRLTGFKKQPILQPLGGYYTPPGGTYSVGEPRTMTVFVPAETE